MSAHERPARSAERSSGDKRAVGRDRSGLWRSAYLSHAVGSIDRAMLADILQAARVFNACAGVTGLLMHGRGSFMQYLEGPRDGVDAVMRRIRDDPRHTDLIVIFDEAADDRLFAGWWLAGDSEFEGVGDIEDFARRMHNLRDAPVDPGHRDEAIRLFSLFWHDRHDAGAAGAPTANEDDDDAAPAAADAPSTAAPNQAEATDAPSAPATDGAPSTARS